MPEDGGLDCNEQLVMSRTMCNEGCVVKPARCYADVVREAALEEARRLGPVVGSALFHEKANALAQEKAKDLLWGERFKRKLWTCVIIACAANGCPQRCSAFLDQSAQKWAPGESRLGTNGEEFRASQVWNKEVDVLNAFVLGPMRSANPSDPSSQGGLQICEWSWYPVSSSANETQACFGCETQGNQQRSKVFEGDLEDTAAGIAERGAFVRRFQASDPAFCSNIDRKLDGIDLEQVTQATRISVCQAARGRVENWRQMIFTRAGGHGLAKLRRFQQYSPSESMQKLWRHFELNYAVTQVLLESLLICDM